MMFWRLQTSTDDADRFLGRKAMDTTLDSVRDVAPVAELVRRRCVGPRSGAHPRERGVVCGSWAPVACSPWCLFPGQRFASPGVSVPLMLVATLLFGVINCTSSTPGSARRCRAPGQLYETRSLTAVVGFTVRGPASCLWLASPTAGAFVVGTSASSRSRPSSSTASPGGSSRSGGRSSSRRRSCSAAGCSTRSGCASTAPSGAWCSSRSRSSRRRRSSACSSPTSAPTSARSSTRSTAARSRPAAWRPRRRRPAISRPRSTSATR